MRMDKIDTVTLPVPTVTEVGTVVRRILTAMAKVTPLRLLRRLRQRSLRQLLLVLLPGHPISQPLQVVSHHPIWFPSSAVANLLSNQPKHT